MVKYEIRDTYFPKNLNLLRAEVPAHLKAIKRQQEAYMQLYDVYVSCAAYPKGPSDPPKQWKIGDSGGFKTIGFNPGTEVRGTYMVSTSSVDFTAIGIIDADNDGVYATYIATKSENPNYPVTAPDIY